MLFQVIIPTVFTDPLSSKMSFRHYILTSLIATCIEPEQTVMPLQCLLQLEAIIRISESLSKMELQPFATESHVDEALRLFHVSTISTANTGSLAGAEGFTSEEDYETLLRIEKQLKRRFPIGTQVSESNIINDFLEQKYPLTAIKKVIYTLIRRGVIQHRMQRKMLYRLH